MRKPNDTKLSDRRVITSLKKAPATVIPVYIGLLLTGVTSRDQKLRLAEYGRGLWRGRCMEQPRDCAFSC